MAIYPRKTSVVADMMFTFRCTQSFDQVHSGVESRDGNPIGILDSTFDAIDKGSISTRFGFMLS